MVRNIPRIIKSVCAAAIVAVVSVTFIASCGRGSDVVGESAGSLPPTAQLYQELKSVDKMVFASMSITKSVKMESEAWYKVGKRIAVYSYDTYMRAYVDMSQLQESDILLDESDRTVQITLPPVTTEVTGRDMTMRKEYENIGLFRSELDSKERAEMKEKANESFVREVQENPQFGKQLTDAAQRKARKYFEALCESAGYVASVRFRQ